MWFMLVLWIIDFFLFEMILLVIVVVFLIVVLIFFSEGGLSDEYSWNRISDMVGYFGMLYSIEYDVEVGVGVKFGVVM